MEWLWSEQMLILEWINDLSLIWEGYWQFDVKPIWLQNGVGVLIMPIFKMRAKYERKSKPKILNSSNNKLPFCRSKFHFFLNVFYLYYVNNV